MSNIDTNINSPCNPYKSFIVKASAGSGKTYQLSFRFFYLVLSGADPKNIYTITFTKKAATEMKDRIYKLSSNILYSFQLQQDIIDQMKVFNPKLSLSSSDIMSACKKILSTDNDLKISTIDSLFYEWVKLFPYESLLFDQDFFFDIASQSDIDSFKTKAWTLLCESISLSIDKGSFQKEFPYTYFFIKQEGLLSLRSKLESLFSYELFIWEKLFYNKKVVDSIDSQSSDNDYFNSLGKEFFTLFKIYYSFFTQIKQNSNLLTYIDITKGVYTIFNTQEFISCRYMIHSSIHHLLIDEFQDTNKIQWNIFKSISEDILSLKNTSTSEKNTLSTIFFVGDIKQSIYGFREADPTIMLEAETILKKYGTSVIFLDQNYRSAFNLINYTNQVFSKLIPEFTPSTPASVDKKDFIPNNSSISFPSLISGKTFSVKELREKEATLIATFIKENISKLKKSTHTSVSKLEYKDIVILYRKSTDIDIYEKVFQKFSIPFKKESSTTFFKTTEILDLMSLIKTILFKNDLSSFSELIKSKIINMSDDDFINLLVYNKEQNSIDSSSSIHIPNDILNNYSELNIILEYQKTFLLNSSYKLMCDLVYKLDIFSKYQYYFPEQYSSIYLNILKFLDLIYTLEQDGTSSLMDIYHNLETQSQQSQLDFTPYQNDDNAVSFMSIHKSKGLEFSTVFLIDTASDWKKTDSYWIKSHKKNEKEFYLYYIGDSKNHPDHSLLNDILANAKIYIEDELIRLLYVALTRASNYLFISGYIQNSSQVSSSYKILEECFSNVSKNSLLDKNNSSFLDSNLDIDSNSNNYKDINDIDDNIYSLNDMNIDDLKKHSTKNMFLDNIVQISPHSLIDTTFKDYKLELDENLETSTASNISLKNSSDLNYGTLVHKGMEFYIKQGYINEEILKDISPSYMDASTIHKAYLEIDNLINSSLFIDLIKDSTLESEFRLCSLKNKVMITGSIDLLIKKDNSNDIIVIDYKTGNFDTIYYNQIKEYKNMVKDLYPESNIKSYILKTKTQELIEII